MLCQDPHGCDRDPRLPVSIARESTAAGLPQPLALGQGANAAASSHCQSVSCAMIQNAKA